MADRDFNPGMESVDWAEVYNRQAARGDLTGTAIELLTSEPGDDVLALGCGPGSTVIRLARRANTGTIYTLDRRRGALRYLRSRAYWGSSASSRSLATRPGCRSA